MLKAFAQHAQELTLYLERCQSLSILPWQESMTLDPVLQILNAAPEGQKSRTLRWKDGKLAELAFVGLTSALITAVFVSGLSWTMEGGLLAPVQGLWYSGLLLALVAVTLAMQQSVLLHRLSSNDNGMEILRSSLGYQSGSKWKPRKLQILIWQMPVMLLNVSLALFDIGLLLQVWGGYVRGLSSLYVTVMFAMATTFAGVCYVTSSVGTYTSMGKGE